MWIRSLQHKYLAPADGAAGDGTGGQPAGGGATAAAPATSTSDAGSGGGQAPASSTSGGQSGTSGATKPGDGGSSPGAPTSGSTAKASEEKPDGEGEKAAGEAWGADWREKIAGEDADMLKRLTRYNTPKDALAALSSLQARISKGELRSMLPKNATPEQIAEWRKENDIPEAPEKYEIKLRDGLVIGDADKPIIDAFLKRMHGAEVTNKTASQLVEAYYDIQEEITKTRHEEDGAARQAAEDALRDMWGGDYKVNRTIFQNFSSMMPKDVQEALLHGRAADGTPIGSTPAVINWFVTLARELNPTSTLVPTVDGRTAAATIDSRIAEIEKMMPDRGSEYWKNEKVQEEYRNLLTARERATR